MRESQKELRVSPNADHQDSDPSAGNTGAASGEDSPKRREVAVALQHQRDAEHLPKVIASGEGAVARQILEIAFARGIKVREDGDLAEVLAAIDVDSEIPLTALAAVAEILSYVYRASADEAPGPRPQDNG